MPCHGMAWHIGLLVFQFPPPRSFLGDFCFFGKIYEIRELRVCIVHNNERLLTRADESKPHEPHMELFNRVWPFLSIRILYLITKIISKILEYVDLKVKARISSLLAIVCPAGRYRYRCKFKFAYDTNSYHHIISHTHRRSYHTHRRSHF